MSHFKNTRVLTDAALLTALGIILGFLKIPVTNIIEIRFGSIPIAIAGSLFGPAVGAVVGALTDIGGYLVRPTGPFFPGFTVSNIAGGAIFGFFLHKKDVSVKEIVLSEIVYTLLVTVILNSVWLTVLYGTPFKAVIAAKFVKGIVMIPINTLILVTAVKSVRRIPSVAQSNF